MLAPLAALATGTLVSEDLTCLAAGMLVASGYLPFPAALAACLAGIVIGDGVMFGAAHWFGRPLLRRRPMSWLLREETLGVAETWLHRNAVATLVASRVLPGARMPAYVALGLAGAVNHAVVRWYLLLTLLWTPLLVAAGTVGGAWLLHLAEEWRPLRVLLIVFPLVAVWAIGRTATAFIRRRALASADLPPAPPAGRDSLP
jgi:membrane protein DedA with SNARE-associated domain